MLGRDMSFTLAALNPCAETRTGSKSVFPLADDPPPAPLKGLPVVWERSSIKGVMPGGRHRTCLRQASHGCALYMAA